MFFTLILLFQRAPMLVRAAAVRRRLAVASRDERGQATAEYALVLLGAAAVAVTLVNWAGGGHIAHFFDVIFERLMAAAK